MSDFAEQQKARIRDAWALGDYTEIARDLNVSEAVVRKRVSRGLAALRHRMGADDDR